MKDQSDALTSMLPIISGLFSASLVLSNTLDTKIFSFFGLDLPAGVILFPIVYVFGDILTEVYGFAASRKVIWTGFFSLLIAILSYHIAIGLPSASFWANQSSFESILSHVPRLVLASIFAYLIGEFFNSYVVAKLKVKTQGRGMPIRFIASTFVGQFFDTGIFVLIAFVGVFAPKELLSVFVSGWAVKVAWEVIALPITIPLVNWMKKKEGIDHFDHNTSFNPLRIN